MSKPLPLRAYWHRKIRNTREPVNQAVQAFDYLRAVARRSEPHIVRRAIPPLTQAIREIADEIEASLPREGKP